MIENRGKSRVFQPEAAAKKNAKIKNRIRQKNAKKNGVFLIIRSYSGAPSFLFFGY